MSIIEKLKQILGMSARNGHADSMEMISCDEALSVVNEFLDGELEDFTPEQVRAHFDACVRCYPYLRLEEAFRDALRRASSEGSAPPHVRERLLQVLAEADS